MMIKYTLVIPCYNEADNLNDLIDRCNAIFQRDDMEVILVDNGSSDDTPQILAKRLKNSSHIRSIRIEHNQGYGYGILSGLKAAKGDILAWTHADMQTDPADALVGFAMYEKEKNPTQLFVKGTRYGRRLFDRFFAIGMAFFESMLLHKALWEINAQPTIIHRSLFESWVEPPDDYSLDLYAYYQAKRQGIKIKRFPVYFGPRLHGHSHWNFGWKSKLTFIKRTMQYSYTLQKSFRKMEKQYPKSKHDHHSSPS